MVNLKRSISVSPQRWLAALVLAALSSTSSATAHEFWIAPRDFTMSTEADLVAELRIGEEFVGSTFPYLPPQFVQFDLTSGNETLPLPGRIGDDPALNVSGLPEGLAILSYVSTPSRVTYEDPNVYDVFVAEKDLDWLYRRNEERGLSIPGLTERFTRYAKSLVGIGNSRGEDRALGLETEIVVGLNPYRDDISEGIPATVYLDGVPRSDVQVEIFQKLPDGQVTYEIARTDDMGRVLLRLRSGAAVLINSVAMLPVNPLGADNAAWHSLWASMTFAVPDDASPTNP